MICSKCKTIQFYVLRTFSKGNFTKSNSDVISRYRFKQFKDGKKRPIRPADYALLLFPATTLGLGIWQMQRKSWKLNLIEELNRKRSAPAVLLPDELSDIEALEYQKVWVRGSFDHSRETYIGPRSPLSDGVGSESSGLIGDSSRVGWHVITPFCLEGGPHSGQTILVNRGWVQNKMLNPESRKEAQIAGTIVLEGVVRKTEHRQQFAAKNQKGGNRWQYRDLPALAMKLGTEPIFLDADMKSTVPGGPIGGQTRVSLPNDHFTYMLTWYTLSAATFFMWCQRFLAK